MAMSNLLSRFLVAVVAVPPLLWVIYQSRDELVWAVVFAASLIAMAEYLGMALADKTDRIACLLIGAGACAAFYWLPYRMQPALLAVLIAVLPTALYYLFRFGDLTSVADRYHASVVGILYGGLLFTFLAFLKKLPGGADIVLLVLCTAWLSDTGGYFAGKYLGKRKLYEAISPKKTWAGSIGGIATVLAGTAVVKVWRIPNMEWVDLVLLVLPGAVLGQIGDLCESMIKRSKGVKDSGTILPGHGGILDRVDAVLFIAPYFYAYLLVRANI
jgi:phosphatidate cytidylyltransferase